MVLQELPRFAKYDLYRYKALSDRKIQEAAFFNEIDFEASLAIGDYIPYLSIPTWCMYVQFLWEIKWAPSMPKKDSFPKSLALHE